MLVEQAQQGALALGRHLFGPLLDRQRRAGDRRQRPRLGPLAAQRRCRLAGRPLEVIGIEPVDVGEVGGAVGDYSHPGPLLLTALHRLDPRLVDRHREPVAAFGEDLGEPAAVGESALQHARGDAGVEQLAHAFGRFPASSIRRPAATNSSAPAPESPAWSPARPPL